MDQTGYTQFLKPLTGKLLSFLKLDKVYTDGHGNWLLYEDEHGTTHRVFDLTGGYGANLLGHKNPEIIHAVPALLEDLPPSHLQGSIGKWGGVLARELSDRLSSETGAGPWVATLANSGAEAVEAALKHSLLVYREQVKKKSFLLNTRFNFLRKRLEGFDGKQLENLLAGMKRTCREAALPETSLNSLEGFRELHAAIDFLEQENRKILFSPPWFLAVEGVFTVKRLAPCGSRATLFSGMISFSTTGTRGACSSNEMTGGISAAPWIRSEPGYSFLRSRTASLHGV